MIWLVRIHFDKTMAAKIEEGTYNQEHTIELAIPLNMPYPSLHERGYEQIRGKFEYKGDYYKLIKHRVENDTVFIVCVKNVEQKRVEKTITDYANLSNDFSGDDPGGAAGMLAKLLKDYNFTTPFSLNPLGAKEKTQYPLSRLEKIHAGNSHLNTPPPEA